MRSEKWLAGAGIAPMLGTQLMHFNEKHHTEQVRTGIIILIIYSSYCKRSCVAKSRLCIIDILDRNIPRFLDLLDNRLLISTL